MLFVLQAECLCQPVFFNQCSAYCFWNSLAKGAQASLYWLDEFRGNDGFFYDPRDIGFIVLYRVCSNWADHAVAWQGPHAPKNRQNVQILLAAKG